MTRVTSLFSILLLSLIGFNGLLAFQYSHQCLNRRRVDTFRVTRTTATARAYRDDKAKHFLLEEFCTHAGEVVKPYETLKISRNAERTEIRKAYITLSKRYHPDGVRYREILPGKCNNLDDVREEWERIKLSYEILSDKKTRRRYDRHVAIADPQGAIGRAAIGAVGKGISGLGYGLFSVGEFVVQQITKEKDEHAV